MKKLGDFNVAIEETTFSFANVQGELRFRSYVTGTEFVCGISRGPELLVATTEGEAGQQIARVDLRPLVEHMAALLLAKDGGQ